jgi:CHAT domain-containing protein/Tfp pilus assembly protein PilF
LSPGLSLEREIQGGTTASFELKLAAGTFLLLEISQRSLSLSSSLLSASGEPVASGEGIDGPGYQLLAGIAKDAGVYRLDVTARGQPEAAGKYGLKVRELRPWTAGDETRVKAARDLAEGRLLLYVQRSPAAITRLKESLSLWQAAKDGRGETETLGTIAGFYRQQGDEPQALSTYQKGLQRSLETGCSEDTAWILVSMGLFQVQRARFDEAVDLYQRALEIWEKVGGAHERAFTLESLGNAYLHKREPAEALKAFTGALPLAEECGDLKRQTRVTLGLGSSQFGGGQVNEALATFEKTLVLSRSSGDADAEQTSEYNLSALYQRKGQLQKAVDVILRLIARGGNDGLGPQYRNLGALYLELGDPERARESYERSREEYRKAGEPDGEVDSLIGVASVFQKTGNPKEALATIEQARKIAPEESWKTAHYLGRAQSEAGLPAKALTSLNRALKIAQESRNRLNEATTLLVLGSLYVRQTQPVLAAERFGQAIQLGRVIEAPAIVAPGLLQRALVYKAQGRLREALNDADQAREIVESTRRNIAGQDLKASFFADQRKLYELSVDLMVRLARLHPEEDYPARAFEVSEASQARGLLDLLAEGRIDVRQGLSPELRLREDRLADELSRIQLELRNDDPKPERRQHLQAEMGRLDRERGQLEVEIRSQNQRYADVRYPRPLKLSEIQSQLIDEHTALLEFALGEDRSVLFVVTRKEMKIFELPPAGEIDRQVRRLRKAVEQESLLTRGDYLESAFQLYRDLLAPAAGTLEGIPNLLIVPDGSLYYVPFEALLTESAWGRAYKDLPYVLRRHSIAYAPSASVLAGLIEPREDAGPASRKQLVAFAPFARPASGAVTRAGATPSSSAATPGAGSRGFVPLPASLREISDLAGLYPTGTASIFSGDKADEDTVKNDPDVAKARRLHFATHAQIDERFPENSALVFAERGSSHGLLQVYEIFNLKLSADLAVLSACQTALGKEVTGEGLVGLTRAFFYAGVPSLVVSLWNVVDGSTPDLMVDFYKDLDRLRDKAKALQGAKLSMIAHDGYAHPSYWAPFVLIGAPR